MSFVKQKRAQFVKIISQAGILMLFLSMLTGPVSCSIIAPTGKEERSAKVNKRINKKHQKKYEEGRQKFLERHYERQSERTKKRMKYNARKAESWRERNLNNDEPGFFQKIGLWFNALWDKLKPREKGLYGN
jgi:hypothetical protein